MPGLGVCPDKLSKLHIQGSDTGVEFAPLGAHLGDQLVDAGAQPLGRCAIKASTSRSSTRLPCGKVIPRSGKIARSWLSNVCLTPTTRERARCRVCRLS